MIGVARCPGPVTVSSGLVGHDSASGDSRHQVGYCPKCNLDVVARGLLLVRFTAGGGRFGFGFTRLFAPGNGFLFLEVL